MNSTFCSLLDAERERQNSTIELIASENFPSYNIRMAQASCLISKYAEGYPDCETMGSRGRYYGGCKYIDGIEDLCRKEFQKVFNTDYHANVQPHSGSQANMAAYMSILSPGDTILSMSLDNGGHLSHGSPVNFSGKLYNIVNYGLDKNGYIDFEDFKRKIIAYAPDLIVVGASAYPRILDFKKFKEVIEELREQNKILHPIYLMVDMAHIAGLVAAGMHPSPFGYADIITTTTHKTLRGPRGGVIFCKPYLAKKIDGAVFPTCQGGPLEHVIAAKCIAAQEAQTADFKAYISNVMNNCKAMEKVFAKNGIDMVTGGTDNHLILLDLTKNGISGKELQEKLEDYNITANKNCIPNDKRSPKETSGLRIGTAAMTTRGFNKRDAEIVAEIISAVIKRDKEKIQKYLQEYDSSTRPHLVSVEDIGKNILNESFWKTQL